MGRKKLGEYLMTDLLLFFGGIIGMIIIGCAVYYIEKLGTCKHKWSKWFYSETEFAFLNQRTCDKCGFVETNQFRKMMSGQ